MLDIEIRQPQYTIRAKIDGRGQQTIFFNGDVVANAMVWGTKGSYAFERSVDGRLAAFNIILQLAGLSKCRCQILENGKEVHSSEHKLAVLSWRNGFNWFPGTPRWGWIFVGLCLLIPLVTLGGAIPAAIGLLGTWGSSAVAGRKNWPIAIRIVLCIVVVVASWISLGVALMVLHPMFSRSGKQ